MDFLISKKMLAVALSLVILMALVRLPLQAAKERRGSTVEVTMIDGSQVKGELLAVKSDVLLVYNRAAGQGKSLNLQQAAKVKVLKKSKFLTGLAIGLGGGLVMAVGSGFKWPFNGNNEEMSNLIFPLVTSWFGGILGGFAGMSEKFSLAGESSRSLQQNLVRLKRHAREQDAP